MKVATYLGFGGNCREAFDYYAKVLGGKIGFRMTFAETPMAAQFPQVKDKIMHSELKLPDGGVILGADNPEGKAANPHGFSVCISVKDAAEGKRIFQALAEGGQIQMPYEKTFWSDGFGMCVDKFETPWMVNTEGPMPN